MPSPRFGYWALVASAAAIAAIGVVMLAWGLVMYHRMPSKGAGDLGIGGVVMIIAGGYGVRWLLERGQ